MIADVSRKGIAVIGGDLRQSHLAGLLAEQKAGCDIYGMFMEKDAGISAKVNLTNDIKSVLPRCRAVIFPLPLYNPRGLVNTPQSDAEISFGECLRCIPPKAGVLAGMAPPEAFTLAREHGIELEDYYLREEFAVLNAVPTAEGALAIAINETRVSLFGATCLILGYGRIGKVLAKLLVAAGARVRVAARKHSDRAWAGIYGCEAVAFGELKKSLGDVDFLFNTVPAAVLGEEKLSVLPRRCLIIDLASDPGGVDCGAAKALGLKAIRALSLPGRVAPYTAGEIILSTAMNILSERGAICD